VRNPRTVPPGAAQRPLWRRDLARTVDALTASSVRHAFVDKATVLVLSQVVDSPAGWECCRRPIGAATPSGRSLAVQTLLRLTPTLSHPTPSASAVIATGVPPLAKIDAEQAPAPSESPRERMHIMERTDRLLTPAEVARMFGVDPKTVTRWATAGLIGSIRTPGGHRRFRETEVTTLLLDETA